MTKLLLTLLIFVSTTIQAADNFRLTHYDDLNGMSTWHTTKILQDKNGFMWFSTWNGLNRYDGYDFAVFKSKAGDGSSITSDRIRNMIIGDDGNIYCNINNHVWRFNLSTYIFEEPDDVTAERYKARIDSDTSLSSPRTENVKGYEIENTRQLFTDKQNNIWALVPYGVTKVSPAPQPAYYLPDVPHDVIRCMARDRQNRIWIAGRDNGVVTLLDSSAKLMGYLGTDGKLRNTPVPFAPIYCVTQQKDGTIWLGGKPSGLYRLKETSPGNYSITHFTKGSPQQIKQGLTINTNDIYDIKEDKHGRLWIATHGGGINMIENPSADQPRFHNITNAFTSYPKDNLQMRRLLIANDSTILATTTEGFLVMTGTNKHPQNVKFNLHHREAKRKESLSCSAVMDMLFDRKGRLFLSTESGGVNMLTTKDITAKKLSFKHYNTENGMGTDVALAMTEIGDEILIQCNNQVTRLNADLNTKENYNLLFFTFPARFSDAAPILLKDGRWLLSLESGVLVLPEDAFHQRTYTPRITLTSVIIPGKKTKYTADMCDTLRLAPNERDVTITYAALDFTDNTHIKYITRLTPVNGSSSEESEEIWSMPSNSRRTALYNLTPGTYTLEIRSTNAEGLWAQNTRTITIIVEPTFWETTLAYVLYIIITVLLISGVTYTITYINNLKRQREETLQAYLKLFEQATQTTKKTDQAIVEDNSAPVQETEDTQPQATQQETLIISPHLSIEDDNFMRRLLTFVENNISDSNIGVDEIAQATALSRSSLNRKMKTLLGVTPSDFIKEARMKKACKELLTTDNNVNDIAFHCGFSDAKYFSKCFKTSIGMTPSEYRREHNNK